jgi:hypothetical protein
MAREKAKRIRFRFVDCRDSWWVTNEHVGGNTGWAVCAKAVTALGTLVKDLPSEESAREWLRLRMVETVSWSMSDIVKRKAEFEKSITRYGRSLAALGVPGGLDGFERPD